MMLRILRQTRCIKPSIFTVAQMSDDDDQQFFRCRMSKHRNAETFGRPCVVQFIILINTFLGRIEDTGHQQHS